MTYESETHAVLLARLKTVVNATLIAEENKEYDPPDTTPYVRETLLPGIPNRVEVMQGGRSRQYGVYQVDIFTPSGIGSYVADSMANSIAGAFVEGTGYGTDVIVHIVRTYTRPGREDGDRYHKPLVIEWWIME